MAKLIGGLIAAGIAWWWLARKPAAGRLPSSVLLVGDSLAVGLGPPLTTELKPVKLTTRAYVSATAKDWALGKYKAELVQLLQEKPDILLVSLGTNDTVPPPGELSHDLPEHFSIIAGAARKVGAVPVFLVTALPWSDQRIEEAAALAGAKLIRTVGLSHAPDGIHLTSTGYAAWAKLVAPALKL